MKVPLTDVQRKIEKYESSILDAIRRVVSRSNFILGDEVAQFETEFSQFIGVKECIGVANGTDALEIALKALKLPPKSKIIAIANAGGYSTTAILNCNLIPKYVDIDYETGNLCLNCLKNVDFENVSGAILTHLYGNPIDKLDEVINLLKAKGIQIIEDCAQAHGAEYQGKMIGTFGDLSCFSFYPTKNLGCLGDGGAILSSNRKFSERARKLRSYGWGVKYEIEESQGRNSRLDELQAAVLRLFLANLADENDQRKIVADRYRNEITCKNIQFLREIPNSKSSNHLFPVLTSKRLDFINHLNQRGIQAIIHYPILDTQQNELAVDSHELINSEEFVRRVVSIPLFPGMLDEEISYVIQSINEFV